MSFEPYICYFGRGVHSEFLEFCMTVGEQYKNIIYICIDKVCITT